MRKLTVIAVAITAIAFLAIGPAPRYLEELRIGGGYGEPADGGADFARDGAIDTDGPIHTQSDLSAGAYDGSADHRLTLRVPDAYTAALDLFEGDATHGGSLWFDGALDALRLGTRDGAGPIPALDIARGSADIALHGRLTAPDRIAAAAGLDVGNSTLGADGSIGIKSTLYTGANTGLRIAHNASGANDFGYQFQCNGAPVFQVNPSGVATAVGDVKANGGTVYGGSDGATRGVFVAWDGAGGHAPGYIKLHSPAGNAWHLFVGDTGLLRISATVPTSNTDGYIVGLQF